MSKNKKTPNKHPSRINKKLLVLIVASIIVYIIIDIFVTGVGKVGYTDLRCGGRPVETVPRGFSIFPYTRSGYILPGDNGYGLGAGNNYYCTQSEAESKGLRVDPFTKESLRQDIERNKQLHEDGN